MTTPAVVSLVCDVRLATPEALATLDDIVGTSKTGRESPSSRLLASGLRVTIEMPKFGEDLPLTLDFSGSSSREELVRAANGVGHHLHTRLGWKYLLLVDGQLQSPTTPPMHRSHDSSDASAPH